MSALSNIKKDVIDYLKSHSPLSGVEILEEFEPEPNKSAIESPIIFVGIEAVDLSPSGLGGYFGEQKQYSYSGGFAKVTLRFDCYSPQENSAISCHVIFEEICVKMMGSKFGISKIYCDNISSKKAGFSNKLTAKADILICMASEEELKPVTEFIIKRSDFNYS